MRRLVGLVCLASGCIFFDPGGGLRWGFAPPQQLSWTPTPPRPPGVYNPLPVTIPLGRPPERFLPIAPAPEPEYVPLTVPTEASVWLEGHWRWEDRVFDDGVQVWPASGWAWAEGRWIEKPCPELELAQPQHQRIATGERYLEAHWRCGAKNPQCVCPAAGEQRLARTK